jgi:hypothetical protein
MQTAAASSIRREKAAASGSSRRMATMANDRDQAYKPFSSYKSSSVKGGSAGSSRRRPAG